MDHLQEVLLVQFILDGPNLGQLGRRTTGGLADAKNAKWTDLESGWVRVFQVRCRPDFATESAFDDRFERRLAPRGEGLGLDQEIIGEIKGRFQNMGDSMVLRVNCKVSNVLAFSAPCEKGLPVGESSPGNVLVHDGRVSGVIGVGRLGVADSYQDLAILDDHLAEFGAATQAALWAGYGITEDEARRVAHLRLDRLF